MNALANAISNAFTSIIMPVSTKIASKFSKVGEVTIYCPTLEDAGFQAERQPLLDEKTKAPVFNEDGSPAFMFVENLPIYVEAAHNWIQEAMLAQVKAQARNKLVTKTANLKDGATIATDWPSLTAEGDRGGNGDALAATREVKEAFKKHVVSLGKSAKAQETLTTLFNSKQSLALQSPENKEKMVQYINDFVATVDDANMTRWMKYLEGVNAACAAQGEADDF